MVRAVLLDPTGADDLEFIRGVAPGIDLAAPVRGEPSPNALLPGAAAIVSRRIPVTGELMDAAGPSLRLVQLWSGRRDRVDLPAARARRLAVALMPQRGCIAVAEQTLMLMLGLSKKVVRAHAATVGGEYRALGLAPIRTEERRHRFQWMGLPGIFELYGRTLGLVGFGEIATEVARRARAFGMEVVYWSRRRLPAEIEDDEGVRHRGLPELLAESDFVSLHVPLTEGTERLIDGEALARMKPEAFLVNTCRGGVVDEGALVDALATGRIAGAGLDVFRYEPVPHDHPLLGLDNVLLAPHLGGGSGGARAKHARDVMANLIALREGRPLGHLVQPEKITAFRREGARMPHDLMEERATRAE